MTARRKLAFALGTIFCGLLLAEGASRLLLAYVGPSFDTRIKLPWYQKQAWAKNYWKEFRGQSTRYEPYVGWRRNDFSGELINIRKGERTVPGPTTGDTDIWCFGGSTMWGSGARDGYTIPAFLSKELAGGAANVRVRNLGEIGWVSTQEMLWLTLKCLRGETPDIVIFYDGINDVYSSYQNRRGDGVPQNLAFWTAYFDTGIDPRKSVWRDLGIVRVTRAALLRLGLLHKRHPSDVHDFDGRARFRLAMHTADTYAANMAYVQRLGEIYGFETLFFWQPMVFYQQDYQVTEQQTARHFDSVYYSLYEQCRSALMLKLVHPIDLTKCLGPSPPEGFYIDSFHLTEDGNAVVARAILEHLRPLLERQAQDRS